MLIIYKMNRVISEFQPALLPFLVPAPFSIFSLPSPKRFWFMFCCVVDSPVFDCCYSEEAETPLNPVKERKGLVVQNVKNIQNR